MRDIFARRCLPGGRLCCVFQAVLGRSWHPAAHHNLSNLSCFPVPPAIGATAAAAVQVRAWVCVVLIVIMRLLNLAVPILYKKVSNLFEQSSLQ
jgi:hypothetical protein